MIPPGAILLLLALGALILAAVMWARKRLDTAPVKKTVGVLGPAILLTGLAGWPATESAFTTDLSLGNQVAVALLGIVMGAFVLAASVGLVLALGYAWRARPSHPTAQPGIVGALLGLAFAGVSTVLFAVGAPGLPEWPAYAGAVSYLPWLSVALAPVITFVTLTAATVLMVSGLERLKASSWSLAGIPLLLLLGLTLAPNPNGGSWVVWGIVSLAIGLGAGGLWLLCRRFGWAVLPGMMATVVILGELESALSHPFPGHTPGALVGMAGVAAMAFYWTRDFGNRVSPGDRGPEVFLARPSSNEL